MSSPLTPTSEHGASIPETSRSTDYDDYGCACDQPGSRCCREGCAACGDGRAHRELCWDLFPKSRVGPYLDADCCACGNSVSCRAMRCEHSCCLAPRRWRRLVRCLLRCPSLCRHLVLSNNGCEWYPRFFLMQRYAFLNVDKLMELGLPPPKRPRLGDLVRVD